MPVRAVWAALVLIFVIGVVHGNEAVGKGYQLPTKIGSVPQGCFFVGVPDFTYNEETNSVGSSPQWEGLHKRVATELDDIGKIHLQGASVLMGIHLSIWSLHPEAVVGSNYISTVLNVSGRGGTYIDDVEFAFNSCSHFEWDSRIFRDSGIHNTKLLYSQFRPMGREELVSRQINTFAGSFSGSNSGPGSPYREADAYKYSGNPGCGCVELPTRPFCRLLGCFCRAPLLAQISFIMTGGLLTYGPIGFWITCVGFPKSRVQLLFGRWCLGIGCLFGFLTYGFILAGAGLS